VSEEYEQARREAEKLLAAQGRTDTSIKAEEAKRLLDEVGLLHARAKPSPVSEEAVQEKHTRRLAERIMRLEAEQKIAREQINHLHHAKAEFDLSRLRKRERESGAQQASNEVLDQQLDDLIQQKEAEYLELVREVEAVRLQAERETSLLAAQRDAARASIAQQREQRAGPSAAPAPKRMPIALVQAGIFILGLALGLFGVYVKFVIIDRQPFPGFTPAAPPLAEPAPPLPAPAESAKKILPPPKPLGEFRDDLNSGGQGPLMVKLPGGAYTVGSAPHLPYPDEHPQHEVSLRGFSIAKYETSFAEYSRFAEATGRSMPDDAGFGQGRQPVINVSWEDATAYARWLTNESGRQYRLPSEREWEYAASAGDKRVYWWGDELGNNRAVCAECGSRWDGKQPAPAGSLPANPFGLHDMLGNVMEWMVECRHLDYRDAPSQGQVWEGGGDCTRYMVRGGSYRTYAKDMRATKRAAYPPKAYSDELGFRVVRVD
jgi:formylglycine-generating enzyme required for sulfatase activity